jgi:hypothetical protein
MIRARRPDTGSLLTDNQMWLQVQIAQLCAAASGPCAAI